MEAISKVYTDSKMTNPILYAKQKYTEMIEQNEGDVIAFSKQLKQLYEQAAKDEMSRLLQAVMITLAEYWN